MLIISLVEEDIFAVPAFGGPLLEDAFFIDPVLCAETLPVHSANCFPSRFIKMFYLWSVQSTHLDCHIVRAGLSRFRGAWWTRHALT